MSGFSKVEIRDFLSGRFNRLRFMSDKKLKRLPVLQEVGDQCLTPVPNC